MVFRKVVFGVLAFVLLLLVIIFLVLNSFFKVELKELNGTGELTNTLVSPNEEYKADLFLINEGGATVEYQERVSVTSLKDNKSEFNDETIYWIYPSKENLSIEWKDDNTIVIDGVTINIKDSKTYYNWKKQKS